MNLNKTQLIVAGIVIVVVLVLVLGIVGVIPGIKKNTAGDPNFPTGAVTLEIWGVGDEAGIWSDISKSYQQIARNIKVNYTGFPSLENFDRQLLEALSERRGPDLFIIPNSWIYAYRGKLFSSYPTLVSSTQVKNSFPEAVSEDVVFDGNVMALPTSFDALVLLYNKSSLDARGVVFAPRTWEDFLSSTLKLKEVDDKKQVLFSAAAFGGARNISHLSDILGVLFLQGGSPLFIKDKNEADFDSSAERALSFYLQFSDPVSPYYTWNEGFPLSLESMASEKTAMALGYFSSLSYLKEKNPFLRVEAAPLPQLSFTSPITIASYPVLAVSAQAPYPYVAWHFARFLTMDSATNSNYLERSGKLPALRSAINSGMGGEHDAFLRSFLYAKTWRRPAPLQVDKIFEKTVTDVLSGKAGVSASLRSAKEEINKLY